MNEPTAEAVEAVANLIPLGFTDRDPYRDTHEAARAVLAFLAEHPEHLPAADMRVDWSFRFANGFVPERWGSREWAEGAIEADRDVVDGLTLVRRAVVTGPWMEVTS